MITARELPSRDYLALKDASAQLLKANRSARNAAKHTRVGHQHLSNCANKDELFGESYLSVDVIADLEAAAGKPIVTDALAALSGHVLVHLPDVAKRKTPLGRITGEAMKETSEVFSTLGERLADGRVSRRDFAALHTEIREAMAALARLDLQLQAEAGE